jgi:hypothetical protein
MPSRRQQASGSDNGGVNLLGMLRKERVDVAAVFRSVIQYHLGGRGEESPRERQARFQKAIQECVEKEPRSRRGAT